MLIPYATNDAVARDADQPAGEPGLPSWVDQLLPPSDLSWGRKGDFRLQIRRGAEFNLVTVRVPEAVELSAPTLEADSAEAYRLIAEELRHQRAEHPVRLWNFIPGILSPLGSESHRYMVFNAGRFAAMEEWLGSFERFRCGIATASGVGHHDRDLVVHCLAATEPGMGVENPRQIPAYCYSHRYGRRPPSFARATRIDTGREPWLLVGGTASVLGEDSAHLGNLEAQLAETLRNLSALVEAARRGTKALDPLASFSSLRVYYVRPGDLPEVASALDRAFSGVQAIEYVQADLCRPELLVEIEGIAKLPCAK